MLLRLEAIPVHPQVRRAHKGRKRDKFPTCELGTIAKVEIFAQRVVLPASALLDTRTSPQSGGSIEVEKPGAAAASGLFQQKVSVQKDCLHAREQRITAIQVSPASLNHSHFWVGKVMDRSLQSLLWRNKIRVQDTYEFAFSSFEPYRQRAGLETSAVDSMNALNIEPTLL